MELSVKHSQSCLKTLPLMLMIAPERHTEIPVIPTRHFLIWEINQLSSFITQNKAEVGMLTVGNSPELANPPCRYL